VKLSAQLAELRSRYTDRYPDVVVVQDQIAAKEKLRQKLVVDEKNSGAVSKQPLQTNNRDAGIDPQTSAVLAQLQGQLESNRLEVENRGKSITAMKERIAAYQSRLNAEPIAEQQLAELTRGYEQSKENYDDLLKKESGSEMATSMERMQQGQRFTTLDPPSLPSKPDFPNRLKFCGFGLIAGLGLGLAVVAAFEFFDDRLETERQIRSLLPVAVIWEVPAVQGEMDLRRAKMRLALGLVSGVLVMVTILGGSLFSYLRG
jgi:succinoglycan biosynthesis transport protein ExoP